MAHSKAGQVALLDSVRGSSLKGCSPALKNIYLFLAVLGLRCCVRFPLVAVDRLLIAVASLAVEQGLPDFRAQASSAAYGLSCMGDLPGSGIEPVSPELVGGYFTIEPRRKPCSSSFKAVCMRMAGVERKNHQP